MAESPGSDRHDAERLLVGRARGGDFEAFEQLVVAHQQRIYRLGRRIVGQSQDADEVVQQTFLSVIEHLPELRDEARFSTWLTRIATNHALVLLRRRTRRATVPLQEDRSDESGEIPHPSYIARWSRTPEEIASQHETQQLVDEALGELDEKYRLVFLLRDVEGLSTAEAAEVLGIGLSNVKVRLLRARLMLRERLTRLFGDEATQVHPGHKH